MYFPKALVSIFAVLSFGLNPAQAQDESLKKALEIMPKQPGIDFDRPTPAQQKDCQIESAKARFGETGWVVIDGNNRVIRKFIDTNGDKQLDQWSYYKDGIEVYRDVDSNFDRKADQYRWLGTAGTRWGIDDDQDGKIDSWKMISAEEVSYEVVEAVRSGDIQRYTRLLIKSEELDELGVGKRQLDEIKKRSAAAARDFSKFLSSQKAISKNAQWIHFGGMRPGVIPSGTDGSTSDVIFYDSVAAVVDNGGGQHTQLSIGTLINVEGAWRLVDLPEPIVEGQAVRNGALFFQASYSSAADNVDETGDVPMNAASQELFKRYEEVDAAIAKASGTALAKLNEERAELLVQIIAASSGEDRSNWIRQLADTVSGSYQNGEYSGGSRFLQDYVNQLKNNRGEKKDDIAYVQYRLITAYYSRKLETAKQDEIEKTQDEFIEKLNDFVKAYETSEHAPDAMMQLGLSAEFSGDPKEASQWYSRIVSEFPRSHVAGKARGADTRLNSEGKRISFGGKTLNGKDFRLSDYSGKAVLIQYWATWCEPCKNDFKTIKEAYNKYRRQGFTVVSVSLDSSSDEVKSYLQSNPLPWIHLYEEGGLDSPLSEQLGIALVPTMMLIGKDGKVIDRNITAADLDRELNREHRK